MKPEIQQLLKETNLPDNDKLTLKFLIESIETNTSNEFINKTYLFGGPPGIGKTYFTEHLIKLIDLPVLFIGPFKFEHKNVRRFNNLLDLKRAIIETKECIVYIDDLQNAIRVERDGIGEVHLSDSEAKNFIQILEHIKRSKEKKYFFMTLNDDSILEDSWEDRIETKIDLEEPKEKSKKTYLTKKYSEYICKSLAKEIAIRSIGYNFRDMDELIRISYRQGNGKINQRSIKIALTEYTPTSLGGYHIVRKHKIKLKDVIGNEKLKKELSYLNRYIKNPSFFSKMGIERSNVIMFAGLPGTGKTFMAEALAGELDVPLINLDGRIFFDKGSIRGVGHLVNLSRKFRNCIIFVDEIDKFIGGQILEEEGGVIGTLEAELDGINKKLQSIVIFTMNNKYRFGSAFHDRIPCFTFGYPSEEERKEFISKKIEKTSVPFSRDQIARLTQNTNNLSYRQIEKILNNIFFKLIEKSETPLKDNKITVNPAQIDESINEILGYVQSTKRVLGVG